MRRREFIKLGGVSLASATLAGAAAAAPPTEQVVRTAGPLRLILGLAGKTLHCRLENIYSRELYADGPYSYEFGDPEYESLQEDGGSVHLSGTTQKGLHVEHRLTVDNKGWIEDQIRISNPLPFPVFLGDARAGYVLPIPGDSSTLGNASFSAIPFLREPGGERRQYATFSLTEVLSERFSSTLWNLSDGAPPPNDLTDVTDMYAAEAWYWQLARSALVISKYSQNGMEWSLLDRTILGPNRVGLRWGGMGSYHGNPVPGRILAPGETHQFGTTRVQAVARDRNAGFYAFRAEREERGHGCPRDFDPPIHWNELYDNKLLSIPGGLEDVEARSKFYTLADMKEAAATAMKIGCEALYLDPGWDTSFGSKIWDEKRLGSLRSFVDMLQKNYGLKCSLHTPLSGWCDAASYSEECYRLDRYGERAKYSPHGVLPDVKSTFAPICGSSRQYIEETCRRLVTLADQGVVFFMFDGTFYRGECWDPNHGHPVPARHEDHAQAMIRIARIVHESHPTVLIEMHDPVISGMPAHYTPIYYGHGCSTPPQETHRASGFDSVWAFELMWSPMEDLLSGRSIALYYYALAYSLPLYLHVDLRVDNDHALVFWWNASTCRHIGFGGTHKNPLVAAAHRQAVHTYRKLKPLYARGRFFGLDEETHIHVAQDRRSAAVNCFNLSDQEVQRVVTLDLNKLQIRRSSHLAPSEPSFAHVGDRIVGTVHLPPRGHRLIALQDPVDL